LRVAHQGVDALRSGADVHAEQVGVLVVGLHADHERRVAREQEPWDASDSRLTPVGGGHSARPLWRSISAYPAAITRRARTSGSASSGSRRRNSPASSCTAYVGPQIVANRTAAI